MPFHTSLFYGGLLSTGSSFAVRFGMRCFRLTLGSQTRAHAVL